MTLPNLIQDKKLVNPNLSTIEYENETGNKQIKPDKECTEDVCQLCRGIKSISFYFEEHNSSYPCLSVHIVRGIKRATVLSARDKCKYSKNSINYPFKHSSLRSENSAKLSLSIDGERLEPDSGNFIQKPGSIFTLIKMPLSPSDLSTRVKRDRPNHQRACVHRVVCHEGGDVVEKMRIIPICKYD